MNVNYNYPGITAFKCNFCNFRSMKEMTSDEHFLKMSVSNLINVLRFGLHFKKPTKRSEMMSQLDISLLLLDLSSAYKVKAKHYFLGNVAH